MQLLGDREAGGQETGLLGRRQRAGDNPPVPALGQYREAAADESRRRERRVGERGEQRDELVAAPRTRARPFSADSDYVPGHHAILVALLSIP
jgi:hypothetical protein